MVTNRGAGLEREKDVAVAAAHAAGAIIRDVYRSDFRVKYKRGDRSPVTRADHEADREIRRRVRAAFPADGWLSEETVDSAARLDAQRVWVVDPMDGTKEFIDRVPEFCVSIALIQAGRPVVGVVYNPTLDHLFWAVRGTGAWRRYERGGDRRLQMRRTPRLVDATVLSSRSETKRGEWAEFRGLFRARPMGSIAGKLASLAAGEADASFTLTPKNEWDICAGALLVEEAGGRVTTLAGTPIRFNQATTLLQGLIASNGVLHTQVLDLITPHLTDRHHAEKRD